MAGSPSSVRGQVVDELDDELGEVVGGRGLAGEEERARRHVELRVLPQAIVEHDDVQRVQQLPLVFVDALDLRVEDRLGIDDLPVGPSASPAKRVFASRLALRTAARNALSSASGLSFSSWLEVGDPAVADGLGDDAGERRIGQQQEAALRDAVGLVVETLGKQRGEIRHDGLLQQLRMHRGHAVGAVRADDGQVRHAHLLGAPSSMRLTRATRASSPGNRARTSSRKRRLIS